jgi:hypothetical protein
MSYKITEIAKYPTVISKVHESVYRSYQILLLVERLLLDGTPPEVVSQIISELRTLPSVEESLTQSGLTQRALDASPVGVAEK